MSCSRRSAGSGLYQAVCRCTDYQASRYLVPGKSAFLRPCRSPRYRVAHATSFGEIGISLLRAAFPAAEVAQSLLKDISTGSDNRCGNRHTGNLQRIDCVVVTLFLAQLYQLAMLATARNLCAPHGQSGQVRTVNPIIRVSRSR